jgi:hypothetical protein
MTATKGALFFMKTGRPKEQGKSLWMYLNIQFIAHARKPQAFKPGDEWHPGAKPALAG